MAQGEITAKLTDIHLDYNRTPPLLSAHVERYQEDSDGALNSVGGTDVQIPVPDLSLYFKVQLKVDIVAAAKAQNPKIQNTVS